MVIAPATGDKFHHSHSSREFQLCHPESGNVYKFQVGGKHPNCDRWLEYFHKAVKPNTAVSLMIKINYYNKFSSFFFSNLYRIAKKPGVVEKPVFLET